MKIGDYYFYDKNQCVKCMIYLTYRQYAYSQGVCPYCGNIEEGTFVSSHKLAVKKTKINPSWMFWRDTYKHEIQDNKDQS